MPIGFPQRLYSAVECWTVVGDPITHRTEVVRADLRTIGEAGCQEQEQNKARKWGHQFHCQR